MYCLVLEKENSISIMRVPLTRCSIYSRSIPKKKSQSTSVLWWMLYWHYAQYVWDAKKKKRSKDLILLPPLLSSDGRQIIQSFLHLSSSSQEDFVKKQIQHVASSAQSIHTCISMPFNSPSNARNIHGVSAPNYLMQDHSPLLKRNKQHMLRCAWEICTYACREKYMEQCLR